MVLAGGEEPKGRAITEGEAASTGALTAADDDEDEDEDMFDEEVEDISKIKKELLQKFIIHPELSIKTAWDIYVCVLIVYSVLTVIYYIGFQIDSKGGQKAFEYFVDCCFGVDILLCFRTAYFEDIILVSDWRKIGKKYTKFWFWLDFLSTFPFEEAFGSSPMASLLRLGRALRLVRLVKIRYV